MLCNSKIFQEKKWWMKEKCVERSLINNKTPHSIMNKLFIIQLCLCQYCAFITNLWNMSSCKHVLVKLSQKKKKKKKKGKKLRKEVSYTLKVTAPMNKSVNNTNSTLATPTLIGSYLWANGGHTHTRLHLMSLFCSYYILTLAVVYNRTVTWQHGIYLFTWR